MKIAQLLYKTLRYTNIHRIFRYAFQRNSVTILMFHQPSVASFQLCIDYLKKHYNIISLQHYLDFRSGKVKSIPKYSTIITMDDGHKSNFDLLPLAKDFKIKPTIFLTSGTVNSSRHYWTKCVKERANILKYQRIPLKELEKILKDNNFNYTNEYETRCFLNIEEINQMKEYFDFQSHGVFHRSLPFCPDKVSLEEIKQSKCDLGKLLDTEVNTLAFPFGLYSEREIEFVKQAGYECAITVDYGFNNKKTNIFRLKRLSVNDTNDINELIVKSSGIWAFLKNFGGLNKPLYIKK